MIKQAAQTGTIKVFRQRRKLMAVFVLLLLFANQTWASGLCLCVPEGKVAHSSCHTTQSPNQPKAEAPLSDCHTAQFPDPTTAELQETATSQSTHHCSETESLVADVQPGKLADGAMTCCHLQPNAEAQATPITARNQGLIVAILPSVHFTARTDSVSLPENFHHPHHNRPIYLSYSCLLIYSFRYAVRDFCALVTCHLSGGVTANGFRSDLDNSSQTAVA